ncbi:MAG: Holliday junction resolvase RuvX, partial [Oscillospiraceae bacterium]
LVDVEVVMWDERSSTVSAINIMNENNVRGKKRKETLDAAAAAIILESYLAYRRNHPEEP